MRPAYYHQHDDASTYFGDDDVHGEHPRPRAHEFDEAPGLALLAYVDDNVEQSLMAADAIYREEYGRLARESAYIEFKLVDRSHWLYDAVAPDEYLLWWRRPRTVERDHVIFPWLPESACDEFTLFTSDALDAVVRCELRSYDQERGRAATGWAAVRFVGPVVRAPGVSAEFERVDGRPLEANV